VDDVCWLAKLHIHADAEAVAWLRRGIESKPQFLLKDISISPRPLALLGELDEARATARPDLHLIEPSQSSVIAPAGRATIQLTLPDVSGI